MPTPDMHVRSDSNLGANSLAGSSSGKKTKNRDPLPLGARSDHTRNISAAEIRDGQESPPREVPYTNVKPAYKVIIVESPASMMASPAPDDMHQQVLVMQEHLRNSLYEPKEDGKPRQRTQAGELTRNYLEVTRNSLTTTTEVKEIMEDGFLIQKMNPVARIQAPSKQPWIIQKEMRLSTAYDDKEATPATTMDNRAAMTDKEKEGVPSSLPSPRTKMEDAHVQEHSNQDSSQDMLLRPVQMHTSGTNASENQMLFPSARVALHGRHPKQLLNSMNDRALSPEMQRRENELSDLYSRQVLLQEKLAQMDGEPAAMNEGSVSYGPKQGEKCGSVKNVPKYRQKQDFGMKFKFSSIVAKNVNMRQACSRSRKKRLDSIQNNVSHIASPSFDESFDPATSRDFGVEGQEFKIFRMDADSKALLMQDTERITIPQPTSSEEQHPLQNHGLRPPPLHQPTSGSQPNKRPAIWEKATAKILPLERSSVERRSKQGVSPWQGGQGRSALESATAGTTLYIQNERKTTKEVEESTHRRRIEANEPQDPGISRNRKSTDIE